MDEGRWRDRAREALTRCFEKRSYPRQALVLLILVTGLIGFLVSVAMLRAGVTSIAFLQKPSEDGVAPCAGALTG
jgi:hypothetical protein